MIQKKKLATAGNEKIVVLVVKMFQQAVTYFESLIGTVIFSNVVVPTLFP